MYRQFSRGIAAAFMLAGSACTDVELQRPLVPPGAEPEVKENTLNGTFCTEDPATVVFPLKVWFVIDHSGSMANNDPNQARYLTVKALADRLKSPEKVFFGGSIFNGDSSRRFSEPRFTDNVPIFSAGVDAVAGAGIGSTPYLAALNLALGELTTDINENSGSARRTRYVVIFLSDGDPTDSQEPQILTAMDSVMALKGRVAGITVNTVYLGGGGGNAQTILRNMATKGEGIFKSFPNGDALDYSGFDFSAIRRTYTHRMFVISNRSMVPTSQGQLIDSDTDGIGDEDEKAQGTDPTKTDTDGDGCNDLVEIRVGWNPVKAGGGQCSCATGEAARDTDKDGLNDCEERWIGTSGLDPDSDLARDGSVQGDLVPDGLDYIYMDEATFPNTTGDRDVDGHLDLEELSVHTAAMVNDVRRDLWAYRYPRFQQRKDETRCYDFQVDNITLGHTLAAGDRTENENLIEMYFAESPQDDPHKNRLFRVARKKVKFVEGGLTIDVTAKDFSELLSGQDRTKTLTP